MNMNDEIKVKRWMIVNIDNFIDECNEVDCTSMAENAAEEFDLYEDDVDYTIPEFVFDLAVNVSERWENQREV